MNVHLTTRSALVVFVALVVFIFAMAIWWVVFMAQLVGEKVDMAVQLGADPAFVKHIHQQEISRQIMVGTEGTAVLLLCLLGIWLMYRALVTTDRNKRQQQNFLMAVTHELKTPLASLKLYLDTIESERIPIEKKVQVLPRMQQDINRLERLMDNILQAARFEKGSQHRIREALDLRPLVERVVNRFDGLPTSRPATISRDLSEDVRVPADPAEIERVVDAILDNAFKYHGDAPIDVRVTLRKEQDRAVLTIADRGIGLPRREMEAIFERFYRVGSELTRSASGTGLGLYIARETVRSHGGEISVRSEGPGKGAEFVISLPLDKNA